MHSLILFLGICAAFAIGSKLPVLDKQNDEIIACYYNIELGDNSSEVVLYIQNIDVSLCTHIIYRFVGLGADASVQVLEPFADVQYKGFKGFNDLRKKNPHLKTLVSMTDTYDKSEHNSTNSKVLTDPTLREKLVNNIVNFVKKYEFNGADLDLSYPTESGAIPPVKENFVLLLKALKEKFDEEDFILSVAVNPTEDAANVLYDIEGISKYVNFINLKTFDFRGISDAEKKLSYTSSIYPSSMENVEERKMNINYVVKYWISQGAPPSKLLLGIAFNGKSYTLANEKEIGKDMPFTEEGEFGNQQKYSVICTMTKDPQWMHLYDKEQQVPYLYNGNQIVVYDDIESIKTKAEYVMKKSLGGAAVWAINDDDSRGECGEKYPLLKTLNRVLRQKY